MHIKKFLRYIWRVGLAACIVILTHADNEMSRSIFVVIPPYQSASPEKDILSRHDHVDLCDTGRGGVIYTSIFGGKLIGGNGSEQLTKYFMPYGREALGVLEFKSSVDSSTTDPNPERDLEARHFNIETDQAALTTFKSRITFNPQQTMEGFGITFKKRINRYECGSTKWWFELSFPVVHLKNHVGLFEKVLDDGGGVVNEKGLDDSPRVANMIEAFKQPNWKFGKIDNCKKMEKTGVADIELKIGYNSRYGDCCDASTYVGMVIPTGNRPNGEYLFEPIVGNNHHVGIMFGGHAGFEFWSYGDHSIRFESDTNSRMLFSNHQIRSFDLYDKQWSRYAEVYRSLAEAQMASVTNNPNMGTSGINVFTKCVSVDPRFSSRVNTAFMYSFCNFMAEIGYNFYVRQSEKICLNWKQGPVLKHISGEGLTTYARTIRYNFESSSMLIDNYTPIKASDIDHRSAEHPAVIASTLYLGIGYDATQLRYPLLVGLGGSYQFSTVNTALDQWLLYGKMGLSF